MARRRTLKLSPFNLTRRSTSGKVSRQLVPRGCTSDSVSANDSGCGVGHRAPEFQDDDIATTERESLPTLHEVAQKRAVESWKKIRLDMLRIAIESEALPEDQLCTACTADKALYRCLQCGPRIFFCSQCYEAAHRKTNIFHTGEVWEVTILSMLTNFHLPFPHQPSPFQV